MEKEATEKQIEIISGHLEAQRVVLMAVALSMPNLPKLRYMIQELLSSQRELLLAQSVTDEFLSGLDYAGQLMLEMFPPAQT